MNNVFLFLASFSMVFLLSFQQLNINHHKTLWVFLTSMGISAANYFLYKYLPSGDIQIGQFLSFALGGAFGAVSGMHIHCRIMGRNVV